jgi:hypothetical protein
VCSAWIARRHGKGSVPKHHVNEPVRTAGPAPPLGLEPGLPPSSDALPEQSKAGTDPYANRYQWGATGSATSSPEQLRLIVNTANVVVEALSHGPSA